MRALINNGEFQHWLKRVGYGSEPNHPNIGEYAITIPTSICLPPNDIKILISAVYPNLNDMFHNDKYLTEMTILTTTNANVHMINLEITSMLSSYGKTYFSSDSVRDSSPATALLYLPKFLNTLTLPGFPSHKLTLRYIHHASYVCSKPVPKSRSIE